MGCDLDVRRRGEMMRRSCADRAVDQSEDITRLAPARASGSEGRCGAGVETLAGTKAAGPVTLAFSARGLPLPNLIPRVPLPLADCRWLPQVARSTSPNLTWELLQ